MGTYTVLIVHIYAIYSIYVDVDMVYIYIYVRQWDIRASLSVKVNFDIYLWHRSKIAIY